MSGYQVLYEQARTQRQSGDTEAAKQSYATLVDGMLVQRAWALDGEGDLRRLLFDAVTEYVEILRWQQEHLRAINVLEHVVPLLPEHAIALRASVANLRIEAGDEERGLQEMHALVDEEPDDPWGWIALADSYLWGKHYSEAEQHLLRAARLACADDDARAVAHKRLFDLYGLQRRVEDATDAWEQACRLDPTLKATLPELLRMLIHWHHFRTAREYVGLEPLGLRRAFYQSLIAFIEYGESAAVVWRWVLEHEPADLSEGQDEFAEACVRYLQPRRALAVLEPLIGNGAGSRQRYFVAGLAWAQLRMLDRARWAFDIALRLGDLERPRRTRRGGRGRIFDTVSRTTYGDVIIDPDIRQQLDYYFMPCTE